MKKTVIPSAFSKIKSEVWLLFIAFILPSLLLYLEIFPRQFFFPILGGFPTIIMASYLSIHRISPKKIGISLDFSSVTKILPATIGLLLLGFIFLVFIPSFLGQPRSLYLEPEYYGWYFGMSIFQEIIWRGFAFLLLKRVIGPNPKGLILGSASLFAFSHIYFRSILILVGTWILGWIWGKNYSKFESITGPSISHYLVGFPFILFNYMGGNQAWSLL